jgi:hypothetical protein
MAKPKAKKTPSRRSRAKRRSLKQMLPPIPFVPAPAPVRTPMPNAFQLTKRAAQLVWRYKLLFGGITLIYAVLALLLVRGFSGGTNVSNLKDLLNSFFTGNFGSLASGLTIYVVLLGSAGSSNGNGAYQFVLTIITSLAIIWSLRQAMAGARISIKDAFYKGMYPVIPFIFVLLVICIQLIPLLTGSAIYGAAMGGTAATLLEKSLFAGIYLVLGLWSGYMLSSSLFAIYIVTLPDMTPLKALRSAKDLVRGRRWSVIRKIIFMPVMLLVASVVIMLPIILVATPLARWAFFVLTTLSIVAVHSYLYTTYRELIDE